MRPTPSIRRDNARIETCAAIIRAHLPRAEFIALFQRPTKHFVRSYGSRWDYLGSDPGLVSVARAITEAEASR